VYICVVLAAIFLVTSVAFFWVNVLWSVAMAFIGLQTLLVAHYQRRGSPPIPRPAHITVFTLAGAALGILWFSFQT
jgi:hypothetical protein